MADIFASLPRPATNAERKDLLQFIAAQQNNPASACAYLSTPSENLENDLDALDQPWIETSRVLHDKAGKIIGAACIEWDTEADMAWVYGPWIEEKVTDNEASFLLQELCAQTRVQRCEIFSDIANQRISRIAQHAGWVEGNINYSYSINREKIALAHPDVVPATLDDLQELEALHKQTFPQTYASAQQILSSNSDYATFVVRESAQLVGYCSGHIDNDDLYLDYVAVSPEHRRQGIASKLIAAFAQALSGTVLRLTVGEKAQEAIAMYEKNGWERVAALRAYHRCREFTRKPS